MGTYPSGAWHRSGRGCWTGWRKKRIDWPTYERRFNKIIAERRIESLVTHEDLKDTCLLCSEPMPDKCHRRLMAEYLRRMWGNVQIEHIL